MLVRDFMTRHPIMVPPGTPASEAQKIMAENHIRHLPVAGDGKRLKGLITRQRLALKPDFLSSLNVWEITRYLSDLKVRQLMLPAKEVHTISPDRTVEWAARMMTDNKIGCLPVIEEGIVVGILTEVDLLNSLQQMLGLPVEGVRVTMCVPDRKGEFSKLVSTVAEQGWGIWGIGSFPTPKREGCYSLVLKLADVSLDQAQSVLGQIEDQEILDIRVGS